MYQARKYRHVRVPNSQTPTDRGTLKDLGRDEAELTAYLRSVDD
jgi:hypothetical protein